MSLSRFVGAQGMWCHPGKAPTKIGINNDHQILFGEIPAHGQVLAYYDTRLEEEMLVLVFHGKECGKSGEALKAHVLRPVNEFIFRDVSNMQLVAWKKDVQPSKTDMPPSKKQKALGPQARLDVLEDFVKERTFAWMHPGRVVQFLHLGRSGGEPRVVFESHNEKGPVLSPPHGSWFLHDKLFDVLGEVSISSVSKESSVLEVCFHCHGEADKTWTMYCGSLNECPFLSTVVAYKKEASQKPHVYSDFEFGSQPSKHIYTCEV